MEEVALFIDTLFLRGMITSWRTRYPFSVVNRFVLWPVGRSFHSGHSSNHLGRVHWFPLLYQECRLSPCSSSFSCIRIFLTITTTSFWTICREVCIYLTFLYIFFLHRNIFEPSKIYNLSISSLIHS